VLRGDPRSPPLTAVSDSNWEECGRPTKGVQLAITAINEMFDKLDELAAARHRLTGVEPLGLIDRPTGGNVGEGLLDGGDEQRLSPKIRGEVVEDGGPPSALVGALRVQDAGPKSSGQVLRIPGPFGNS
jgi:hypothetical protein